MKTDGRDKIILFLIQTLVFQVCSCQDKVQLQMISLIFASFLGSYNHMAIRQNPALTQEEQQRKIMLLSMGAVCKNKEYDTSNSII